MQKQNLVVIGNGMAGARTVEEILARGGDQQFDITMFGDEPTGNYNRILLSNVLNGSQRESEIYLNPLGLVSRQQHHAPHWRAGGFHSAKVEMRLRRRRHDRSLRQADHRHRQPFLHSSDGRDYHGEPSI